MDSVAAKQLSPTSWRWFRYSDGNVEDSLWLVCGGVCVMSVRKGLILGYAADPERDDDVVVVVVVVLVLAILPAGRNAGGLVYIFCQMSSSTGHTNRMSSASGSGGT